MGTINATSGDDYIAYGMSRNAIGSTVDLKKHANYNRSAGNEIHAGYGDDLIDNIFNDTVYGEQGSDTLVDSDGINYFDGGSGNDTFSFRGDAGEYTVTQNGNQYIVSDVAYFEKTGIERKTIITNVEFISPYLAIIGGSTSSPSYTINESLYISHRLHNQNIDSSTVSYEIWDAQNNGVELSLDDIPLNGSSSSGLPSNTGLNSGSTTTNTQTEGTLIQGKSLADNMSSGSGNDTVYGNDGDDIINGNQDNDQIHGGNGNDQLRGGRDQDFVQGNSGNDYLYGDKGLDTIRGGQGNDYIQGNSESDLLYGDKGNDTIRGGQGNDTLYGGDGNDFIFGDKGNDVMYGNAGSDIFVFNNDAGIDIVHDFNSSDGDKIQISSSIYSTSQDAYNNINFDTNSSNAALNLGGVNQVVLSGVSEGEISVGDIAIV